TPDELYEGGGHGLPRLHRPGDLTRPDLREPGRREVMDVDDEQVATRMVHDGYLRVACRRAAEVGQHWLERVGGEDPEAPPIAARRAGGQVDVRVRGGQQRSEFL